MSPEARHDLKNEEGKRLVPYVCPAGKWTVGFGHRLYPGSIVPGLLYSNVLWRGQITEEMAELLLDDDIEKFSKTIADCVKVELSQNQYDALISFIFNVGSPAFRGSTMLRFINNRLFGSAAKEFARWCHGDHNEIIPGLLLRRQREAKRFSGK